MLGADGKCSVPDGEEKPGCNQGTFYVSIFFNTLLTKSAERRPGSPNLFKQTPH